MAAQHAPYAFYVGDEWTIDGVLHNADGSVMDLTGAAVQWRLEDAAGTVACDFAVGSGVAVIDAPSGRVRITVTKDQSAALAPGGYFDQCRVTDAAGKPSTQSVGSIEARKSFFV